MFFGGLFLTSLIATILGYKKYKIAMNKIIIITI